MTGTANRHPSHDEPLERLTRAFGQEIFARLEKQGPLLFSPAWWDDRLMAWTMHSHAVKVELFRFIDVLPQLKSAEEINRHLYEYFEEAHDNLPKWAQIGMHWLPRNGWSGRLTAKLAQRQAERLARRFIAGSNVNEALQAIAEMRRQQFAFTVDLLGEATITEKEADQQQQAFLELIHGLSGQVNTWPEVPLIDEDDHGPLPRVNISVKLSSLYSHFHPIDQRGSVEAVCDKLRAILRAARDNSAFVNVDMEQYVYKDLTLRIFRELLMEEEFRDWPDVGIAIQAYLHECERDLHDLASWVKRRGTPVWVRLIKGAYWDYQTVVAMQEGWPNPVYTEKWRTDANYEQLTRFLLDQHEWLRPAFGSHNVRSIAYALAYARRRGIPDRSFELQMLYGMAEPIKKALREMGYRLRVYTPYGQLLPGMAYLVRRLLENTSNDSFLRASFTEHVPEEQLLMNPLQLSHSTQNGQNTAVPRVKTQMFRNEPLADFSQADVREDMEQALSEVRNRLGRSYALVIGGKEISTNEMIASINPSHKREVVGECGRATKEHAELAIAAARDAFPMWRNTSPEERADYLFRAADVMHRRRFELAAWEVFECAKQWREADGDIAEAIDFCRYYAQQMIRLGSPQRQDVPGEENEYFYEPRGVAVVIAPWNFPLAILCGMTVGSLVAGNTVIMKPAEQSSVIGAKLMEVFNEIELPEGVLHYLPGLGEELGPVFVEHPDVAIISFTGSMGVGLWLNQHAAEPRPNQDHVKRVLAEMGGKNAIIVDDDADLDEAVLGVAHSAFDYQGQKCSACSRVIVLEGIYDAFLERMLEATKSLKLAPAEDPGSQVGPVINEEAQERILNYIEKGKKECTLAHAGNVGMLEAEGFYVAPHIFTGVSPDAVIAQEEIFGPVLAVMKAANMDEALQIANGTRFALTGGIFSRSPQNIQRAKREFRVGNLYINRKITGALVNRQPFGGFKLSGIGAKAGGPDYLLQLMTPRTITENTLRRGFAPEIE